MQFEADVLAARCRYRAPQTRQIENDHWWQARSRRNVLFLTYEEMREDLPAAVRRIAAFMGVELSTDEFEAVVRQSSFAFIKEINHKFEPGMVMPWAARQRAMIRQGRCGSSADLLTPAQQRRINDQCRGELRAENCDFPYDRFFDKPSYEWLGAGC